MTRRLEFGKADIHYLANLCHNCGACLHACQYAPPHEFAVNVPQAMAEVRGADLCRLRLAARARRAVPAQRPDGGAGAGGRPGAVPGAGGGAERARCVHAPLAGNFYAVFPHNLLVATVRRRCSLLRGAGAGAWACARFWRDVAAASRARRSGARAAAEAARRRAAPEVPRRRPRRRLQRRRRPLHAVAPALPPLHLLRLHAVLRRHQRGHALPLPARPGRRPMR